MDIYINILCIIICFTLIIPNVDAQFGNCLHTPSFVSNWTNIVAQSGSLSEIVIHHCLGELPVKVDVQVKAVFANGSEDNFMFPGLGSAQRDDDIEEPYGGVVYFYDETTVTLIVPNRHDGTDKGAVVYTGGNIWIGPHKTKTTTGHVRVRIWSQSDFPAPDYQSQWMSIKSGNGSTLELQHMLGKLPEYVSIQVRSVDTGSVSDGVGSGFGYENPNKTTSWGGVLYGYNENVVRVMMPSNPSGSLFSAADGWGNGNKTWDTGEVRVRAWKSLFAMYGHSHADVVVTTKEELEANYAKNGSLNTDEDIFELMVVPRNGSNNGFNFKASGAVQNSGSKQKHDFGGLVYSYSEDKIRVYHPPFPQPGRTPARTSGVLLNIGDIWGHGKYKQQTNYVTLRFKTWSPESTCMSNSTEVRKYNLENGKCVPISKESQATSGISAGAVVGIVIAVLAIALGSIGGIIFALLKMKRKDNTVGELETEDKIDDTTDETENKEQEENVQNNENNENDKTEEPDQQQQTTNTE